MIYGLCYYREHGQTFLKSLPKTLKKLTLGLSIFDDVLASLAQSGLNLTYLEIKDNEFTDRGFGDAKQVKSLQNLTSLKTLIATFHTPIQHFTDDILSNSITKLVAKFYRENWDNEDERGVKNYDFQYFSIDWILLKFPSLESLYIDNSYDCGFGCDKEAPVTMYPNL
jgi:hypothetical protein